MSLKLICSPVTCETTKRLCRDYWAFNNNGNYITYIKSLCRKYNITPNELFVAISTCHVYIDDVRCQYCGAYCPIEVPADIPYMRSNSCWFCEECLSFSGGQVLA